MSSGFYVVIALATGVGLGFVLGWLLARMRGISGNVWLEALERGQERTERGVKEEIARNREESSEQERALREELAMSLKNGTDSMLKSLNGISAAQLNQLEAFSSQLAKLNAWQQEGANQLREAVSGGLKQFNDSVLKGIGDAAIAQRAQLESFGSNLVKLTESNERKLSELKGTVEAKLAQIQADNGAKLEEMRKTVDEKLQSTLERRLTDSFKFVSERLEQVHKGLGEMQVLATGVGDLKKVLTNIKTRGTWGEIQLGNLLEQILTPEQYAQNVITKQDGKDRVEFALRLPGRDELEGKVVWMPIDAKFPKEDYERLVAASERSDTEAVEAASAELEARIRLEAKTIRDKYLDPPNTTDFGILFLPTEGLYAEVLRRPGLVEGLQREYRVNVTGPTTLAALLNSLQMGFRTLAIQQRSSEVWNVLGAVKAEFGKFGEVMERVQKKLQEASNVIDQATTRTRAIERKLRNVQELPAAEAAILLENAPTGADALELAESPQPVSPAS